MLFRKFLIVVTALVFNDNATFQLTVVLMVMFWGYAIQQKYEPYMSTAERPVVVRQHREKIDTILQEIDEKRARTEYAERVMKKDNLRLNLDVGGKALDKKPVDVGQAAAYFFW